MTPPIRPKAERAQAGLDRELKLQGCGPVAGVEEAGRGPLAGPVVAASVILDLDRVPEGLADSKTLSPGERERLFGLILRQAEIGLASVPHHEIDRRNIRQATLLAMVRAVLALPRRPRVVLVDGNDAPRFPEEIAPIRAETIVRGDALVASIAAASIVAKVARDRLMRRMGTAYPAYGFAAHSGYGTVAHRRTLAEQGPCPYHRLSFAPMRHGRWRDGSG